MTVVFDGIDSHLKTIELSEISQYETCVLVLFRSALKRVSLFWLSFWFWNCLSIIRLLLLWVFDQLKSWFADKKPLNAVELIIMLIVACAKGLEFEIGRRRPVETLLRELILICVSNAQADVVVVLLAFNPTPEQKFLKIVSISSIKQVLNSILKLEPLLNVETNSVVGSILKTALQVKNVHLLN